MVNATNANQTREVTVDEKKLEVAVRVVGEQKWTRRVRSRMDILSDMGLEERGSTVK